MKLNQLLVAVAIALSSATAMATNFTQNINVSGGTTSFGQAHAGTAGAFTDTYTFTGIASPSNINIGIFSFGFSAAQNIDFTSVFLNGNVLDLSNGLFVSTANTPTNLLLSSPFTLIVNGISGSNASYAGVLNVAAVPEPESYALMLAGLGLVGFAVRRQKNVA
ncbi:MAG: FxDxF family PEP-CTERM protein [Methylophilaceae bacterium]